MFSKKYPFTNLIPKYLQRVFHKIHAPEGKCMKSLHRHSKIFPPVDISLLDRFLRGTFSRKIWGWRGQKFLGNKTPSLRLFLTRKFLQKILGLEGSKISWEKNPVSYAEFFRQNFLTQNFRKFWLEFSKFPGDEEILRGNFGIT